PPPGALGVAFESCPADVRESRAAYAGAPYLAPYFAARFRVRVPLLSSLVAVRELLLGGLPPTIQELLAGRGDAQRRLTTSPSASSADPPPRRSRGRQAAGESVGRPSSPRRQPRRP